jgi:hypothetical protein
MEERATNTGNIEAKRQITKAAVVSQRQIA